MSLIYNLILVFFIVSSIIELIGEEKPSKIWYYSIVFIMAATAGLAYAISPDWVPYWRAFEALNKIDYSQLVEFSDSVDMEVGYLFVNKAIGSIGLGYGAFTLFIAFLGLYLKSSTFYEYGGLVFLSLFMYYSPYYFFEDNVHLRQGLANAVTIYSIRYIINRNLLKFLICFFIAFLFHKAAVIFLFAYWIVKIRFTTITIALFILSAIIIYYTGLSLVLDSLLVRLPFGVGETYDDYNSEFLSGSILGDIVRIILVSVVIFFNKSASEEDPLFPYFRNLFLVGVFLYFFFGRGIFAVRLPGFYLIYVVFLVPRIIKTIKNNLGMKNMVYGIFLTYTIMIYFNMYVTWKDKTGFSNYKTFFNEWAVYSFFQDKFNSN